MSTFSVEYKSDDDIQVSFKLTYEQYVWLSDMLTDGVMMQKFTLAQSGVSEAHSPALVWRKELANEVDSGLETIEKYRENDQQHVR